MSKRSSVLLPWSEVSWPYRPETERELLAMGRGLRSWTRASSSALTRELNNDREVPLSASGLGSIRAPSVQNGTQSSLLLLKADLCMVMQKMMHSHSVVSAVGQDGARTLRLQSKRILTVTSQSPCLFITHPPTLCWF